MLRRHFGHDRATEFSSTDETLLLPREPETGRGMTDVMDIADDLVPFRVPTKEVR